MIEFSNVANGGANGAWAAYAGGGNLGSRAGVVSTITSEKLWALGGASTATTTTFSGILSTGRNGVFSAGNLVGPIQSTASGLPAPRALGAVIIQSGFIYYVGGTSNGVDATSTTYPTF